MSSSEQPVKFSWKRWLRRTCVKMFILMLVYVLSIGPMYWHWEVAMMMGDNDSLLIFYLPLMLAAEYIPPFRYLINYYIDFWAFA